MRPQSENDWQLPQHVGHFLQRLLRNFTPAEITKLVQRRKQICSIRAWLCVKKQITNIFVSSKIELNTGRPFIALRLLCWQHRHRTANAASSPADSLSPIYESIPTNPMNSQRDSWPHEYLAWNLWYWILNNLPCSFTAIQSCKGLPLD